MPGQAVLQLYALNLTTIRCVSLMLAVSLGFQPVFNAACAWTVLFKLLACCQACLPELAE